MEIKTHQNVEHVLKPKYHHGNMTVHATCTACPWWKGIEYTYPDTHEEHVEDFHMHVEGMEA
jgi:hypothetical protein